MKRLIPFALLLMAAGPIKVDTDVTVAEETYTVANTLATNVAALTATSGVQLLHGGALAVCVSAESTRTVTSGTMRAYVYMPVDIPTQTPGYVPPTYRWIAYPALDWILTGSVRDQCSGDKSSLSGIGRFAYVEDDVDVSGGTTVQVTYSQRSGLPR